MYVAAVQFDIAWEDKPANHARIERMLDDAGLPAGTLVLLPELGDTGFSFDLDAIVDATSLAWARRLASRTGMWIQAGYAERGADGRGANCASLIDPEGRVAGTYRKLHPFSFGREVEHFDSGDRLLLAACGGVTVAPLICYDLRFPEAWRLAALAGAEVFTLGASWPAPRQEHWRALTIARAIENQACVITCNRTGRDPHLAYAGGSMIVDHTGNVLAEGGTEPAVISAELDVTALREWRATFPALADARAGLLGCIDIDRVV